MNQKGSGTKKQKTISQKLKELFYLGMKSGDLMPLEMTLKVIKKGGGNVIISIIPDDKRWVYKKKNGRLCLKHQITGDEISIETLKSILIRDLKDKKLIPKDKKHTHSEIMGARNTMGISKLLKSKKWLEAFLSTHSLMRRKLKIFAYLVKYGKTYNEINYKKIERNFKNTKPLIDYIAKHYGWDKKIGKLYEYNKQRNRPDHEMASFSIDLREVKKNTQIGLNLLKFLDKEFKKHW